MKEIELLKKRKIIFNSVSSIIIGFDLLLKSLFSIRILGLVFIILLVVFVIIANIYFNSKIKTQTKNVNLNQLNNKESKYNKNSKSNLSNLKPETSKLRDFEPTQIIMNINHNKISKYCLNFN